MLSTEPKGYPLLRAQFLQVRIKTETLLEITLHPYHNTFLVSLSMGESIPASYIFTFWPRNCLALSKMRTGDDFQEHDVHGLVVPKRE